MKIQQIIDEQMKEFDKSIFHGPDFLNNFARKLIEAVGKELVGESEKPLFSERYKCKGSEEKTLRKRGRNELRDMQRLKLKEILSNISK